MKTLKKLFSVSAIVALLGTLAPMYAFGAGTSLDLNPEFPAAYAYAYSNGITTQTEANVNMGGSLTRIALAKMIANYAINVLGMTPDTSAKCTFTDVTAALDAQYDNGVTLACQLGLMGQNITAFRPNDLVNRGEFGTTLSRALNHDSDDLASMNAADPYYKEHLNFLKSEGIMTKIDNPSQTEVRGYVMLMMMRADETTPSTDGCSAEELLACITADDYDACIAECAGEEPEEPEVVDPEAGVKQGKLTVSKANSSIETVPTNVPGVEMGSIKFAAGDEDVKLTSVTLKAKGYGNYSFLDNVYLADKDGVRITKARNVNAEGEVTLGFNGTYTLKANSTATFTIVNTIDGAATNGITYGYSLTEVEGPESVKGLPVSTDLVTTTTIQNLGAVTVAGSTYAASVKIGEDAVLGKIDVTLANNKEDVRLVSVKLKQTATNPASLEDSLDNLYLAINGEDVSSKAVVNGKYVTFIFKDGGFVISKDRTSATKLSIMGTATAEPGKVVKLEIESAEDFVIKGETYGYNLANGITTAGISTANGVTIETSEITTSFERNVETDILATQSNINLGTLKLKANDTNFLLEKYVVSVVLNSGLNTADEFNSLVKNVKLGGLTADKVVVTTGATSTTATYTFEDINLPAGTQRLLDLTFDVKGLTATQTLVWDLDLDNAGVALHDEDNDKSYDSSNIANVVSSTSFANTVTVAGATLKTYKTALPAATYVIDAGKEITVAKGVFEAGNNTDVTITNIKFTQGAGLTTLTGHVSAAKLIIDGQEYRGTIDASNGKDININKEILVKKGSANKVEYELVLTLKSAAAGGNINLSLASITAEDSEGAPVTATTLPVTFSQVTLSTVGTLAISYANTQSNKVAKSILGGTNGNEVAIYDIVANNEQINVKDLKVTFSAGIENRVNTVTLSYNGENYTTNVDDDTASFTDLNMVVDTTKAPLTISVDTIAFADTTDVLMQNVKVKDITVTKAYGVDSKTTLITWNDASFTTSQEFDLVPATVVASVTGSTLKLTVNKGINKAAANTDYNVYISDILFSAASVSNLSGLYSISISNENDDELVKYTVTAEAACGALGTDIGNINASERVCMKVDTSATADKFLLNDGDNNFTVTVVEGSATNPNYTIKLEKGAAIKYVVNNGAINTFANVITKTQLYNRQAESLTLVSSKSSQ